MLVLVEDYYGVKFHRELLKRLLQMLGYVHSTPHVDRLPAKKCNPVLVNKVKAKLFGARGNPKIVVVIDSEGRSPNIARRDVLDHFERDAFLRNRVKVVIAEPRHEAWLCIGLGLDPNRCRSIPEELIVRARRLKSYEKRHLAELARDVNIERLMRCNDFREYVSAINWLLGDP